MTTYWPAEPGKAGAEAVLLQGGHLDGDMSVDTFYHEVSSCDWGPRVEVRGHGGGCSCPRTSRPTWRREGDVGVVPLIAGCHRGIDSLSVPGRRGTSGGADGRRHQDALRYRIFSTKGLSREGERCFQLGPCERCRLGVLPPWCREQNSCRVASPPVSLRVGAVLPSEVPRACPRRS